MNEELDRKSFRKGLIAGIIPAVIVCIFVCMVIFVRERSNRVNLPESVIKKINAVEKLTDNKFLFDIDEEKLEESIVRGYMAGLNDVYSVYYNKEEVEELTQGMNGTYTGFGIGVYMEDGKLVIGSVSENGSAYEAGLMTDDIIIAVDGVKLTGTTLSELSAPLSGELGTTSTITVLRDGEEMNFDVTRKNLEYEYVGYEMLEDKIAYIGIRHFTNATINQFKEAVDSMIEDGAEAVIFDVRGNPGGTLQSVTQMLDYLMPKGLIMYAEDKTGKKTEYNSTGADAKLNIPCVILTDENSASASEVFSGALKDHGLAVTVGKNTFGKGIVQSVFTLYDGTAVKLTVEKYFTPNGTCIHEIGIAPDVEVELDKDKYINEGIDTQLNAAIEKIKEMM